MLRFFKDILQKKVPPAPQEIELKLMSHHGDGSSQTARLCVSNTGAWYHLICESEKVANTWASSLLEEKLVDGLPKLHAAIPKLHPQYHAGVYFLRIHPSAIEKIKTHYSIEKTINKFNTGDKVELDLSAKASVSPPSLD